MFALLPQSVLRSTLARLLRVFFIFVLIVSNLLLPSAVVAQAAPAKFPVYDVRFTTAVALDASVGNRGSDTVNRVITCWGARRR